MYDAHDWLRSMVTVRWAIRIGGAVRPPTNGQKRARSNHDSSARLGGIRDGQPGLDLLAERNARL